MPVQYAVYHVERTGISAVASQRRADAHFRDDPSRESRYTCVLSPLDRVACRAQQLQIFVVVGAALAARYFMIDGEVPERKRELATAAPTLLLPKQTMLVRPIARQLPLIRPLRYVRPVYERMLRKQQRVVLLYARLRQLRCLRRQINPRPLTTETLRGDARLRRRLPWNFRRPDGVSPVFFLLCER